MLSLFANHIIMICQVVVDAITYSVPFNYDYVFVVILSLCVNVTIPFWIGAIYSLISFRGLIQYKDAIFPV